ncbi:MFS transporter [Microbacterium enclense]|uniref:MFS transporter n=1 Tax=Microbacterium enclense TaxID=993073 RepID=UPI003D710E56
MGSNTASISEAWRRASLIYFFTAGLFQSTWFARIASLGAELSLDVGEIGLLVGCFSTGSIVGLFLAPRVYRGCGPRITQALAVAIMATLLTATGAAAMGDAPLVAIAAALLFAAVGYGVFDVSMNVSGAEVEREFGRSLLPSFHALYSVGALAGSALTVPLVIIGVPAGVHFTLMAVVILGAVALAGRWTPRAAPWLPGGGSITVRPRSRDVVSGRLLLIGVTILCITVAEGAAVNWIAVFTERDHSLPSAIGSVSLVVFLSATVITRLIGGYCVDRFGPSRTIRVSVSAAVVGIAVYIGASTSVTLVLVGAALWGVGVAMGFPLTVSAAARLGSPATSASRVSVISTFGYGASFAGPAGVGFVAQGIGGLSTLAGVAALLAMAVWTSGAMKQTVNKSPDPKAARPR